MVYVKKTKKQKQKNKKTKKHKNKNKTKNKNKIKQNKTKKNIGSGLFKSFFPVQQNVEQKSPIYTIEKVKKLLNQ